MPKPTTNQLIDTITEVMMEFPWTEHFQEVSDMEPLAEADDGYRRGRFQELAREIAKAVR
jgi:hypothetical protein